MIANNLDPKKLEFSLKGDLAENLHLFLSSLKIESFELLMPVVKVVDSRERSQVRDLVNKLTLRSGLMETVKHACLTEAKMNPGSCFRYIVSDVYMSRTPFKKDAKIEKF